MADTNTPTTPGTGAEASSTPARLIEVKAAGVPVVGVNVNTSPGSLNVPLLL